MASSVKGRPGHDSGGATGGQGPAPALEQTVFFLPQVPAGTLMLLLLYILLKLSLKLEI